jgi:murein DD-endopeptidase MepM/ murein hydrolase activator NlpD
MLGSEETLANRQLQKSLPLARAPFLAAGALVGLYFAGCATVDQKYGDAAWYQKSKQASSNAVEVTETAASKAAAITSTTASKAYARMQQYLAEKEVLKTFYDAGEHSETAVLNVLHKSAVAKQPAPHASAPAGGRQTGQPKQPAPAPVTSVPEQYSGAMRWPLDAYIVSSEYGERWGKVHKGMDMAAHVGEPVYAIADGEVIYAGNGLTGYGNVIILRHDRKTTSLYAHNSELKVTQGDHVTKGALVALLGNTGHSTGPHVHFEIRDGDVAVNPRNVLPKSKLGLLEQSAETAVARNQR